MYASVHVIIKYANRNYYNQTFCSFSLAVFLTKCVWKSESKPHKHGGPSSIPSRPSCFDAGPGDKRAVNNMCSVGCRSPLPVASGLLWNRENRAPQNFFVGHVMLPSCMHFWLSFSFIHPSIQQSINPKINQSIYQPTNQSINHSIITESINLMPSLPSPLPHSDVLHRLVCL